MKSLRLLALFALGLVSLRAADRSPVDKVLLAPPEDAKLLAAVRAADDARVAATKSGDRAALTALYSDALHYAHSNGRVDTKASQIDGVVNTQQVYESIDYKERTFTRAAPGIILMKGRALFTMRPKDGSPKIINDLNYLAVWREEGGKWRFLAWQSCKNPVDAAKK